MVLSAFETWIDVERSLSANLPRNVESAYHLQRPLNIQCHPSFLEGKGISNTKESCLFGYISRDSSCFK